MATVSTLTMSENLQFTPGGPPRRAFESGPAPPPPTTTTTTRTTRKHLDLLGSVPIYAIWLKKFSQRDKESSGETEWSNFRVDTLERYERLDVTLSCIEDELNLKDDDVGHFLDLSVILEKQSSLDLLYQRFEESEVR